LSDFNFFNPFDAFSQDNLLSLDHFEEPQNNIQQNSSNHSKISNLSSKKQQISQQKSLEEAIMEETFNDIVSDDELASMNIKDLNRKLKERGIPKETIEKLKQRRRTLKNRKYATDCREKKDTEVQSLEEAKDNETDTIDSLEKENDELRDKLSKLKSHYLKLFDFAKKNNIELKPRNVPMGSLDST